MKIIGLTGYARTGKDTVGTILVSRGWIRVAFADNVRALALAADPLVPVGWYSATPDRADIERLSELVARVGWEDAKRNSEVRRFLQAIGSGVRDVLGEETWIAAALEQVPETIRPRGPMPAGVVVTDVRHQNEADAIRARGGKIVRVVRAGVGPANAHITETGIDGIEVDWTLDNHGTINGLHVRLDDLLFELSGGAEHGHR